jgi:SagB-type dehydrogenase family enzyme
MRGDRPSSILLLLLAIGLLQLNACTAGPAATGQPTRAPVSGVVSLPAPRLTGETALEEAIASRRSVREFTNDVLSWQDLSQLLWAAQGITDARGLRAAPSAGALYPLEVYVVLPSGAYRYVPASHAVELLSEGDLREDLWQAGLRQDALHDAPAIFVIAAVHERTEAKYGERAERYVKLEAGHAAQNLLLQAVVLKLGAVPIGAFYDDRVQAALSLPTDHQPLYLIPVGHPRR